MSLLVHPDVASAFALVACRLALRPVGAVMHGDRSRLPRDVELGDGHPGACSHRLLLRLWLGRRRRAAELFRELDLVRLPGRVSLARGPGRRYSARHQVDDDLPAARVETRSE